MVSPVVTRASISRRVIAISSLRSGVTGDEFRLVQPDHIREHSAGDVNRVTDRLSADAHAGRGAQLFDAAQACLAVGDKQIVLRAIGRAEIDELVDIVLHARLAQHGIGDQRRAHAADGQPVGFGDFVNVVGGLPAAARSHVLHDNHGIARNIFAQNVDHRARPHIRRTRRRSAENHRDGFVLVERNLGQGWKNVGQNG